MPTSSTREIHIEFDQRVPMRDGITLSADIYCPLDSSHTSRKYPVILTRTPYMKLSERMLVPAKYFAERGYVFVAMDVRGRGDSEDRKSTRLNSSHGSSSYAVFCLKKKNRNCAEPSVWEGGIACGRTGRRALARRRHMRLVGAVRATLSDAGLESSITLQRG